MVNHFYFYGFYDDFGPFFIKFATYFPYTAKVCINGHEWAKRQAAKAGMDFDALDNGFLSCADPDGLQRICDRLSPVKDLGDRLSPSCSYSVSANTHRPSEATRRARRTLRWVPAVVGRGRPPSAGIAMSPALSG